MEELNNKGKMQSKNNTTAKGCLMTMLMILASAIGFWIWSHWDHNRNLCYFEGSTGAMYCRTGWDSVNLLSPVTGWFIVLIIVPITLITVYFVRKR